jgi:hypothetical protein
MMHRLRCRDHHPWTVLVLLTFALLSRSAMAAPPPAPWVAKNITTSSVSGSTDADANGLWSVLSGGYGVKGGIDQLQYAYQPLKGDGSITARFLNLAPWLDGVKAGLMVRENETPSSPAVAYAMTFTGLDASSRVDPDGEAFFHGSVGPLLRQEEKETNLLMRLQRVGQEIAGFYSRDGTLWFPAQFDPVTLPALKEEALFGLMAAAGRPGVLATSQFDQVNVQPGLTSVYGIQACGSDRAALLQWRPLPSAVGYNVYRGPRGASSDQLVKLNSDQVAGASFTDNSAGLVNGTSITYAVAPIFKGTDAAPVEGPRVAVVVTPVAVPAGFLGCSINEGNPTGSAAFDPATGEITLWGAGLQFFLNPDNAYFVSQPVEGDVQITVRLPALPAGGPDPAALLMLRESLDAGARHTSVGVASVCCLILHWRLAPNGAPLGGDVIANDGYKLPVTLRLTRRGNTITPEYSKDDGRTFEPLGEPVTFGTPLAKTLYAGLALNSGSRLSISTAKFGNLVIQKL